ncbi:MAG: hypothetical protein IT490_14810 [Candidatus Contendobacter sp.]|nr:hypothetical protein [Candidatus Contendobacter sp.]
MPKMTAFRSASGSIVNNTRLFSFFASQRVFSNGTVARQAEFLHVTVRAHKYATVGFATQRGFFSSSK